MSDDKKTYLKSKISRIGVDLNDGQAEQFLLYYNMLVEKNRVMNLTRITEFEDVVDKHFADSLAICRYVDFSRVRSILDLGTGAGFPGVPLAIVFPKIRITMIDSVGKKIRFVNEVIEALNASSAEALRDASATPETMRVSSLAAEALHGRAEELAGDRKFREQYDLCVSRAVANLSTLSEYCLPFVKKGGLFAAYKSGDSADEIQAASNAIRKLGGTETEVIGYELEGMGRALVKIRKGKTTPAMYPRKAGIPGKTPLT